MSSYLIPRDRCLEHLKVTTHLSSLLARLVLYRACEMLDLDQLNRLVEWCHEAEQQIMDGRHGVYHQAVLDRAKRQ
jgi:hypothetical protein